VLGLVVVLCVCLWGWWGLFLLLFFLLFLFFYFFLNVTEMPMRRACGECSVGLTAAEGRGESGCQSRPGDLGQDCEREGRKVSGGNSQWANLSLSVTGGGKG